MPKGIYKRIKKRGGWRLSEEHKTELSKIAKEKGFGKWMSGKKLSEETKRKIGISGKLSPLRQRGEKCWNWKGGVTPLYKEIRKSLGYRLWREAVFARDNYTCVRCGQKGGSLHPDHIKPFCDYPELRFAIDNGRTLCESCHRKTDTWGSRVRRNYL